jgi:hypothetical protein
MKQTEAVQQILGMDVEYMGENGQDHVPNKDVAQQEETLQKTVRNFILHRGGSAAFEEAYLPITALSMRYKHIGFIEEKEFRIVAVPWADDVISQLPDNPKRDEARQEFRNKNGLLIPYIELEIPRDSITRIIVGPHPDKERRKQSVEVLKKKYKLSAEVTTSNIPYVG